MKLCIDCKHYDPEEGFCYEVTSLDIIKGKSITYANRNEGSACGTEGKLFQLKTPTLLKKILGFSSRRYK